MKVYHILCFVKLAFIVIFSTLLLLNANSEPSSDDQQRVSHFEATSRDGRWIRDGEVSGMNQSHKMTLSEGVQDLKTEDTGFIKSFGSISKILYLVLEVYIYACINSLFLEINDDSHFKGSSISINQQQRPLVTSQGHQPLYNATLHSIQPGHSQAVVIPLHSPRRHTPH